jgi:anion-transporting  ArsA/GET3 family ATPase
MNIDELLDRRLLVVAGKGGVGKTTVACVLGIRAAQQGLRVLVCEVDGVARASHLMKVEPGPLGAAVEARPGLHLMAIEGKAALAEYLGLIVPVRRFLQTVLKSRVYQYFVAAAPGLKELMTIGKIWYEAERVDESTGKRLWDLVIMDAPATGHSLQYLRMPAAARDAFGTGLVNKEAKRLVELLTDPARTAVNLVTTAEEMPVNETVLMHNELRDMLHMPTGALFINRSHSTEFADEDADRLSAAATQTRGRKEKTLLREVAVRAREESGWTRLNARYRSRLEKETTMPIFELPFLFAEEFGFSEVRQLADQLKESRQTRGGKKARA